MSIFDLFFLMLLLAAVVSLLAAAWFALRRQFRRSRRILGTLAAGFVTYMSTVILVSLFLPRRVLKPDAVECFDDWCIGVAGFKRLPGADAVTYDLNLRLSSRARRVSQRENNVSVYLTDDRSSRYDPVAAASAAPLNVLLGPGESVVVRRSVVVPAGAKDVGVVVTHEGGFPIGWFIIGYDTWFRKPTIIELRD